MKDLHHRRLEAERRLVQALEQRILELQWHPIRRHRDLEASSPESQDSGTSTPTDPGEDYDIFPPAHECHHGDVRYTIKQISDASRSWEEMATDESTVLAKEPSFDTEHPFTWRQIKGRGHEREAAEVIINCPTLRSMIAHEIDSWPLHYEPRMKLYYPFPEIIHNWDRLQRAAKAASPEDPCQAHLGQLLDVIEKSKILRYYFEQRRHCVDKKMAITSYWDLDKLFYPGQLVFATPLDVPQVFLVHESGYQNFRGRPFFELLCWTYGKLQVLAQIQNHSKSNGIRLQRPRVHKGSLQAVYQTLREN